MLFDYIAKNNIRLIYMMIDEYAYLGNCTNEPNCEVYQNMRGKCPDISKYPKSLFFNTCISIIQKKQQYYEKMHNTIFVGPEFLVLNSKKSYLGKFMKSKILDEAIDLTIYSPKDSSSYREHLNISADVKVILCIAPSTNPLKGGQYFVELAWRFMDLKDYVFIYIGYTSPNISDLPSNLIPIKYVEKDGDLAYYYSMADLFVNPSLADAMSNTCIEALSCGTPLLCFNISGMPYIMDNTVGTLVEAKNVDALVETVLKVEKKTPDIIRTCRKYAEVRYDNIQYAEKLIKIGLEE
jgi:glycosyltransferase involved in cell wall biosynthesis